MTTTIAITGKSGNGKTTIAKSMLYNLRLKYPEKSFLVVDNDLTTEFGFTFGQSIRETVYGIRSGKHEYKTGIPSKMTRQEYVEWAIEDIIFPLEENTDLLVTWLSPSKDCRCPITFEIANALTKLYDRYDFIIFDCEYDLKYLMQLVDYPVDTTLVVASPTEESVAITTRIMEASEKYAAEGQLGVVINKVRDCIPENISVKLNENNLKILGVISYDETLELNGIQKTSKVVNKDVNDIILRLNLPIME